jgi:hypothetical protein
LHELRIICEVAELIEQGRSRFVLTDRGQQLIDPARAGELYAVLLHTWLREFNMNYGRHADWTELQEQMAYTLYRLRTVAHEWCTPAQLVEHVVLPYALVRAPRYGDEMQNAAAFLQYGVLDKLVEFGLLDRQPGRRALRVNEVEQYRATELLAKAVRFDV